MQSLLTKASDAVTKVKHYGHETFKAGAEYVMPTLKESKFLEKGVLMPEEFEKAADQLVHICKTWAWDAGDKDKAANFLPPKKQHLVSLSVPCLRRVRSLEMQGKEETVENDDDDPDGWLNTYVGAKLTNLSLDDEQVQEIPDIDVDEKEDVKSDDPAADADAKKDAKDPAPPVIKITENHITADDAPDIDNFEEDNLEEEEEDDVIPSGPQKALPYIKAEEPEDNFVRTRTYDLSITYDKYYQVPRIWLRGYDENSSPLTAAQIMEDISVDHAKKTVTIEAHPHTGLICASIHPCRHADVMKLFMDRRAAAKKEVRVDQYLFLFLKFMSAVIPTIEYDFTKEID